MKFYVMDGGKDFNHYIGLSGEPHVRDIYVGKPEDEISIWESMKLNAQRYEYTGRYYEQWNQSAKKTQSGKPVDALLSCTLPFAGVPHDGITCISYTAHWNLVDFPALVMPVGSVEPEGKDADSPLNYLDNTVPLSESEAPCLALWKDRGGALGFRGLPLTIQLIGRRYEEEHLVGVAKAVRSALQP